MILLADKGERAKTRSGKLHFNVLDGLRGTAALMVVIFHLQGITVNFEHGRLWIPHAYLAVDFFFALSGFVVGYAYDDRWPAMGTRQFIVARLVRLHPLLVLGAVLGLLSYLWDPFAGSAQDSPARLVLAAFVLALFVLPGPMLANRWDDTHPLNGPAWTLLQEYIANLAYALVLRRASRRVLATLAVIAAAALLAGALKAGSLDIGPGWGTLWGAPVRLAYPFLAGLLVFRLRDRLPALRLGFVPLSLVMVAVLAFPALPEVHGVALNALYDFLAVAVAFPIILVLGITSETNGWKARGCRWLGTISYPIYITHFPFAYLFLNLATIQRAPSSILLPAGIGLFVFTIVFAWLASKYLDEPVRAWLRRRLGV